MKKSASKSILALILIISLTSCSIGKDDQTENEITNENESSEGVSRFIVQDIEVFDLLEEENFVKFTRSGSITSSTNIDITPEISGKITEINIKVGDKVQAGDLVAKLGDSLSTMGLEIQAQSAEEALRIAQESEYLTDQQGNIGNNNADISSNLSELAYQNSLTTKDNTKSGLAKQKDALELSLENAELAYDNSKKTYKKAKQAVEEAEDALDDYRDDIEEAEEELEDQGLEPSEEFKKSKEETIQKLKQQIESAESQVDNAKFAMESSDIAIRQSESALAQFNQNVSGQEDQLEFGIDSAYNQYLLSLNQKEISEISTNQQLLNIQSQITQSRSSAEIAKLNLEKTRVTTPINGTVTKVNFDPGAFISPGQPLITVEDLENSVVKSAISVEERYFVDTGDNVLVKSGNTEAEGKIINIAPNLDSRTKKFEVEIKLTETSTISSGSLVSIEFSAKNRNRIFIPLNSVITSEGKQLVNIVNDYDKVEAIEVETGSIFGDYIEITKGLFGDEKIIRDQSKFLKEGEIVNPTDNE